MKRLILMFALFLGMLPLISAQEANTQKEISLEDYERVLDNQLKVELRKNAYKSMGLNEEEIVKMDPIFNEYIEQKRELLEKKFDLIDEYQEEMAEDDTAKDEEEETAGFIENYWELDIKEMELKKDFFDRFEEVVTTDQAINFFMVEESMQEEMERPSVIRIVPMIIEFERVPSPYGYDEQKDDKDDEGNEDTGMTDQTSQWTDSKVTATQSTTTTDSSWTKKDAYANTDMSDKKEEWTEKTPKTTTTMTGSDVSSFSQWVKDARGGVALNHQYTHDGLNHLVNAVWSVAGANGMDISEWEPKKEQIRKMADELQIDPLSTDHADITREAFVMLADMIETIQTKTNDSNAKAIAQSVVTAAHAIDPDELLTRQAQKIYNFFDRANDAVSKMSTTATAKTAAAAYNEK